MATFSANFTAETNDAAAPPVGQLDAFPSTLQTKMLDLQHPSYVERLNCWNDIDDLCQSGWKMKKKAEHFLTKRQKELAEVFAARVQNFSYHAVLGPILRWYKSAMFKEALDFKIGAPMASGGGTAVKDTTAADPFYAKFLANCDRAGTAFVDLAKDLFYKALQFGDVYVLTDLPTTATDTPMASLADQKAVGALDPYLVKFDPRQVINWETDAYGNLEWVVIAITTQQQQFAQNAKVADCWYYFNRTNYAVYRSVRKDAAKKGEVATLYASGRHALADAAGLDGSPATGRVPLRKFSLTDTMWLANTVYLHCQEHLDTDNALGWGIKQGCLPLLWIKGEYVDPPVRSEVGYIHLGEDGSIGYIQPDASTFAIADKRLQTIREEIYRECNLQAQGRSSSATASASSGYSKEMEMAPSRDILSGLADILRPGLVGILRDVCDARGDLTLIADIRGLSFDETDEAGELAKYQIFEGSDLAPKSATLETEMDKKLARILLPDASQELQEKIDKELEAAPSKQEVLDQQAKDQQDRMANSLKTAQAGAQGGAGPEAMEQSLAKSADRGAAKEAISEM